MKTENKIIKKMIEEKQAFTIRQIAERIRADYRITHTAVKRLIKKGVLKKQVVGKSMLCSLNKEYYGKEIYDAEFERAGELLKNKDLKMMSKEIMSKIPHSFFVFLIFGSFATGTKRKKSDIDIMFISNQAGFQKRIESILNLLPLKTHCLVFSENEFKNMLKSDEPNVVKEVVKSCVIIYGIENYYRLLKAI